MVLQGDFLRAQPVAGAGGASTNAGSLTPPVAARETSQPRPSRSLPRPSNRRPRSSGRACARAGAQYPVPVRRHSRGCRRPRAVCADGQQAAGRRHQHPGYRMTFNDPQPYTYAEALDMLNLMLSMKGVMLMETGHYLQLVPFKQLPQMPIKIFRGAGSDRRRRARAKSSPSCSKSAISTPRSSPRPSPRCCPTPAPSPRCRAGAD
ncbi:MAG: hypothetical protein MZV64_71040 [Ignavibacteriales bacterium]|nr:hypothetical protein [Ignavibacteriales bacterium]